MMADAAPYGLKFGGVFGRLSGIKRSFLGGSRQDRDFTDAELEKIQARFVHLSQIVMERANLSARELDVLRGLRDGLGQREIADHPAIAESTVKQRIQKTSKG